MPNRFQVVLGAALCAVAWKAEALSMGPSRGEAIVGQALDLSFDIALDAGSDASSSCVSAELFYGDSRVDPTRVRVTTRAGAQPLQAVVQVSSVLAVNEPVVAVLLRAGCATAVSRRYTLLAGSPIESNTVATLPVNPAAVPQYRPLPAVRESAAPTRRPPVAAAAPSHSRAAARPAVPKAPKVAPEPVRTADSGAAASRPRLELQSPMDWLQEQIVSLRSSDSMATPSLTTTPEQRTLAAAVWRALNTADGTLAPDGDNQQRILTLENQIKTLQTGSRLARGREADLQAQLAEAQSQRDSAWIWMWALSGVVILVLLAAGFLFWRSRGTGRPVWWKSRHQAEFGADAATAFGEGFVDTQPAPVDFLYPHEAGEADTLVPGADAEQAPLMEPMHATAAGAPHAEAPVAPNSAEAAMRAARELRNGSANELADVQQNADFFASLGQYDQAIELLQGYIDSHPGTSPGAYLDLLQLFHTLSLTDPYRKLSADFNAVFNAELPTFATFLKRSRDLFSYEDVLGQIAQNWSRAEVLDLIESFLVRQPDLQAHPPFQLEAYRDLLMLYEVAKLEHGTTAVRLTTPPGLAGFTSTPALAAAVAATPAVEAPAPAPVASSGATIDFALEPGDPLDMPAPFHMQTTDSGLPDLGLPMDFASGAAPARAPHPSLDDIALPEGGPVGARTPAAPADDPHLIDFDMFDVAVPPSDKTPPR
ncbi:hypothetical protein GT347_04300 [Xylophilus rhododendri]|uniref:Tfp pilus assembly protein FimV n=1 Tax=Xylophilus rhododendri TaxID=2697032 RepID=A0A857J2A7_9BURK|nr:hypothetical protein [Xylophilus rhododendri]QHI97269.1 hypothetical protein GT347_04300 [Xylophilus rhododendri]